MPIFGTSASTELTRGFEERISHFESNYTQISLELDAARDALLLEQQSRLSDRRSSTPSLSELDFPPLFAHLVQRDVQQDAVVRGRNSKDESSSSLTSIRAKNAILSRTLLEQTAQNQILTGELEEERATRRSAESDLACLCSLELDIPTGGKLLDTAPRSGASLAAVEPYTTTWVGGAPGQLNASLAPARVYRELSCENTHDHLPDAKALPSIQKSLLNGLPRTVLANKDQNIRGPSSAVKTGRGALIATQDELRLTKEKLSASEDKCSALSEKISSLQATVTTCVDQSAVALEAERELRYEIEARIQQFADVATKLKAEKEILENELEKTKPIVQAWKKNLAMFEQIEDMAATAVERQRALEKQSRELSERMERPSEGSSTMTVQKLQGIIHGLTEKVARQEVEFQMKEKEIRNDMRSKAFAIQRLGRRKTRQPEPTLNDGEWVKVVRGLVRSSQLGLLGNLTSRFLGGSKMPFPQVERKPALRSSTTLTRNLSKSFKKYLKAESSILVDTAPVLHDNGEIDDQVL